ncbi:cytochrome p450 superfamily protein [Cystoisospora suis]|uniref:Cytochrome p450 superfamily protein n=1 Tax=Cystoisospora suis TaxID=483139 RepID=A0A2C6KJY3_9APIC|nr:cytochrome p450 superfamily protein [Cystoisospora suis]
MAHPYQGGGALASLSAYVPDALKNFLHNVFLGSSNSEVQKWRMRILGVGAITVAGAASWVYVFYPLIQQIKLRGLPQPPTSTWLNGDKKELQKYVKAGEKREYFSRLRRTVGANCFIRLPLQFSWSSFSTTSLGILFVTSDWPVVQELIKHSSSLVRNPEWVKAFEVIRHSTIALESEQTARFHRRILTTFMTHGAASATVDPLRKVLTQVHKDLVRLNDRRAIDALQLSRLIMFNLWVNLLTGREDHFLLASSGILAATPKTIEQGVLPYSTTDAIMKLTRFHKENYELLFMPSSSDSSSSSLEAHRALIDQYKAIVNALPVLMTQLLDEGNSKALIPRILAAEDSVTRRGLDAEEIRDNLALLLLAAENTAIPITWALYELAKSPELQERIFASVKLEDMNNFLSIIEAADQLVGRLGEVLNLFLETLRYYPVPVLSRTAAESIYIKSGDFTIPSGTVVLVDNYSLTRDRSVWGEDVDAFNPDRFIGRVWQHAPWIPFGFGSRKCLGERLAVTHAVFFLSFIVRHFILELDDNSMPPLPMECMFLTPDKPVMIHFTPRKE